MSFANEDGLPFVYTLDAPTFTKAKVNFKQGGRTANSGTFQALIANNVQQQFGFVALFEHQKYIAGINNNRVLRVPVEYDVEFNSNNAKNFALKIRPQNLPRMGNELKLLHYSVVPFTTQQDLLDLKPTSNDKNTRPVFTSPVYKTTVQKDTFSIKVESDSIGKESDTESFVADVLRLTNANDDHYTKISTILTSDQIQKSEGHITMTYDTVTIGGNNDNSGQSSEEMESLHSISWKSNSKERRKQIANNLSKGIKSGEVYIFDVSYSVPMLHENEYVFTFGGMKSNSNQKLRGYFYWNSHAPQEVNYEVCFSHEMQYAPRATPLNFKYALKNSPRDEYKAVLKYGKTCATGNKVVITGSSSQSQQLRDIIENSSFTKQCLEEIQTGNKAVENCMKANDIAQMRDQIDVQFDLSNIVPESVRRYAKKIIEYLEKYVSKVCDNVSREEESEENTIKNTLLFASPVNRMWPNWLPQSVSDITSGWSPSFNSFGPSSESQWQTMRLNVADYPDEFESEKRKNKIL